jgi:lipoprotein-anchoring transpeptidase ErfK/SrfK
MRPVFVSAFFLGALSSPAFADPIAITPEAYALSQGAYAAAATQQSVDAVSQQRYAQATQPNLGGGFLEFLFGGRSAAAAYQPATPQYQSAPAPQGYAPVQSYTPEQNFTPQRDNAPQPSYALPQSYTPQQQDYAPQQAYAPSSQGDMAHPQVDPKYDRQTVAYDGKEAPGTIIIDTPNKYLFLVEENGKALRYGIGVGRPGFTWAGVKTITAKREWPDWYPPSDMLQRRPDLPRYMAGGPENPLGARALYLGSTLYRIHGSNEPWTIGTNVSSGCIRMRNPDVIDLYDRVKVGTKVVVI